MMRFFLFLCALAFSLSPCRADWNLVSYSDSDCTMPSSIIPTVQNTRVALSYDEQTCSSAAALTGANLVPTGGTVQWLDYYCGATIEDAGYLLTFTYGSPSGGCPYSGDFASANTSLQIFQLGAFQASCRYMNYGIYNVSTGKQDTGELFGSFSCSNVTSAPISAGFRLHSNQLVTVVVTAVGFVALFFLSAF
jgi:hypothetical protein